MGMIRLAKQGGLVSQLNPKSMKTNLMFYVTYYDQICGFKALLRRSGMKMDVFMKNQTKSSSLPFRQMSFDSLKL